MAPLASLADELATPGARPLRCGDRGPLVGRLRRLLSRAMDAGPADPAIVGRAGDEADHFDEALDHVVRSFQQARGLLADGVVGRQTAVQLDAARWRFGERTLLHVPGHLMRGDDVATLQERMVTLGVHSGPVDGLFGEHTERSLRELQRGLGVPADGVCGPRTVTALGGLGRVVSGGDPWALRTASDVEVAGRSLSGKVIALDPAHGDDGHGTSGHGLVEARVTYDVARRVQHRLELAGAEVWLTRDAAGAPAAAERAALAERVGADLLVSFHCEQHPSADAGGFATYFWGGGRVGQRSAVGERLAALVQNEVVARTAVVDCRSHPCTYDMVRVTKMPAVMVGLGYLTNAADARRLADPAFADVLAEAVVVAVQRLYLRQDEARTGTLRLSDVLARSGRDTQPATD